MSSSTNKGSKRILSGYVISDKNEKSIVVRAELLIKHPLYKKFIRRKKKFMAHDPQNYCKNGDKVQIIEHRPLSAKKRWHLHKIVEKAV